MTANIDPDTGIAYGYVSASELHSDLVDELLYGSQATDLDFEAALEEFKMYHQRDTGPSDEEIDAFTYDWNEFPPAERTIEGELDGVKYASSWLGGALNFFILKSSHITDDAGLASPCVPNAGILDAPGGGVRAYTIPDDWWFEKP